MIKPVFLKFKVILSGLVLLGIVCDLILFACMQIQPTYSYAAKLDSKETSSSPSQSQPVTTKAAVQSAYAQMPLNFEPNLGQTDPKARYLARAAGYQAFITEAGLVIRTNSIAFDAEGQPLTPAAQKRSAINGDNSPLMYQASAIYINWLGANPNPQLVAKEKQASYSNYFIGNQAKGEKWLTDVAHYGRISYPNLYEGIDLELHSQGHHLQYDFVVAPGANPDLVKLEIQGASRVMLSAEGALEMEIAGGKLYASPPLLYQVGPNGRQSVAGGYKLDWHSGEIGFEIGQYDTNLPLVIDPTLYTSYLGGSSGDAADDIAVDNAGQAHITGSTASANFPAMAGLFANAPGHDVFVSKLNANGNGLIFSTYLGGGSSDYGNGIAVLGSNGTIYVTGSTTSDNFPTVLAIPGETYGGGFNHDIFVSKLSATGNTLVYSTYVSGPWGDIARDIAVNGYGNAFITGSTQGGLPITENAAQPTFMGYSDAFVLKLSGLGSSILYSSYLGGTDYEDGEGIAIDGTGNAYVTGWTASYDFPTTAGVVQPDAGVVGPTNSDSFVTKLNSTGTALVYSTYLGGTNEDHGYAIAVDSNGKTYITGNTRSTDFPTTVNEGYNGGFSDSFVTRLNSTGTALVYSIYLGGSATEYSYAITIDGAGNAFVAGDTDSADFPITANAPDVALDNQAGFVSKLNSNGTTLLYSTYLDGIDPVNGSLDSARGVAVDNAGYIYVVGMAGPGLPTTAGTVQPAYGGELKDGFVWKLNPLINGLATP